MKLTDPSTTILEKVGVDCRRIMPVNIDKPHLWNADTLCSVDRYNRWFMQFAPKAYRDTRIEATERVELALKKTANFSNITVSALRSDPAILSTLRMATAPPIARDRLIGLAGVQDSLVDNMEKKERLPPRMRREQLEDSLEKLCRVIMNLVDVDIFPWIADRREPSETEVHRAATVVADRDCGAHTDPIMRNAQENQQLDAVRHWLEQRAYTHIGTGRGIELNEMAPGTFSFRHSVSVLREGSVTWTNVPIDAVVMPKESAPGNLPLLIEAKSAGDHTNTNKRRKEEADKLVGLRRTYGDSVQFILFLFGYFNARYLGYEAADGIDWVWEHRVEDLAKFGL